VIVFRKLVVVGLVVGLGSFGLGCGSKTRYSGIPEATKATNESYGQFPYLVGFTNRVSVGLMSPATCDLPDAPAEKLYYRAVYLDDYKNDIVEKADFKWSESDEWTRVEAGEAPFDSCRQEWLDRIHPPTTTMAKTTTTLDPVVVDRCRSAMETVKKYLYTSDNKKFDVFFRVTLKVCGNRRTWQSVAREVGGSIDGMLTAACMLNGNTAVCKN
jgi:hypothetical protein